MELQDLEKIKATQPGMVHARMLYKHPGPHNFGKEGMFDYCVVDQCDEVALNMLVEAGWKFTIQGAKKKDSAVEKAVVSKLKCEKEIAEEAQRESPPEKPEEIEDPKEDKDPEKVETEPPFEEAEDPEKVEADEKVKAARDRLTG